MAQLPPAGISRDDLLGYFDPVGAAPVVTGSPLLAALSPGTARMAALLAAQEPSALAAIANDIDSQAERFRRDESLAIPIAAVLARGRKSAD